MFAGGLDAFLEVTSLRKNGVERARGSNDSRSTLNTAIMGVYYTTLLSQSLEQFKN